MRQQISRDLLARGGKGACGFDHRHSDSYF